MKGILYIFLGSAIWLVSGCSTARVVKPLNKGETRVGAHFGSAMVNFGGLPIPLPLRSLYGAYGLSSKLSVQGGLGLTASGFGVAHIDIGATQQVYAHKRMGISVTPTLHFMQGLKANPATSLGSTFRFYPQLDANAFWEIGKRNDLVYTGVNNLFDLNAKRAHNVRQDIHWLPALQVGYTHNRPKMQYTIELKYMNPAQNTADLVPEFIGIARQGAVGVFFGVTRKFNTEKD